MASKIKVTYEDENGDYVPLNRPWPRSPDENQEWKQYGTLNGVPLKVEPSDPVVVYNQYKPEES